MFTNQKNLKNYNFFAKSGRTAIDVKKPQKVPKTIIVFAKSGRTAIDVKY